MPMKRPKYIKNDPKPRQHYIDNGAWAEILDRISQGEPVRNILEAPGTTRKNKFYPSWSTWWRMVSDSEELRNEYLEAKRKSAEADAQKMESIVDNLMHSNTLDERRARVALDGLKFIMAFKEPRKYGKQMGEQEDGVNIVDVLDKIANKLPGA